MIGTDGDVPVGRLIRGGGIADDAQLLPDRQLRGDLRSAGDLRPTVVVLASVPRWLQRPARLVIRSVLGRVHPFDPIAALSNRMQGHSDRHAWNPSHPARVGVMPREENDVRCSTSNPATYYQLHLTPTRRRNGARCRCVNGALSRMFDRDRRSRHLSLDRATSIPGDRCDRRMPRLGAGVSASTRLRWVGRIAAYTVGTSNFSVGAGAALSTCCINRTA